MTLSLNTALIGYTGALTIALALKGYIIPAIAMGYVTYLMLED